ncbi:CPSF4 factor, partial [Chionis minor]|nr:CPSF4 factor [Chionis minor]
MQELVAGVEKIRFDLEVDVEQQRGARPLPFLGVDSKGGGAWAGSDGGWVSGPGAWCPFRHVGGEKAAGCKHWLGGLRKRGGGCDFLRESGVTKMPECCFYSKFGRSGTGWGPQHPCKCSNKDCPFLHIDATAGAVGCHWYDHGFCRHGPLCRYKHAQRVMCTNYLVGFCPEGPKCKFM